MISGYSIKDFIVIVVMDDDGDHDDCGRAQIALLHLRMLRICDAHTCNRGGVTKGLQLTSIPIETAHTRDIVGGGGEGGGRVESRGEAICLPNEMSPRLYALRCGQ